MADQPIDSKLNYEVIKDSNGNTLRRSIAHLPAFYRTDANHRFLSSTLDQLIQPGELERLDGFIGREYSYTREYKDKYINATNVDRKNYQLEPAVTYTDKDTSSINPEDQVKFTSTYDDYINQINFFGGDVSNHDRLNREKVYAWNPAIDFDKLINYREYFWMPEGPSAILINAVGPNVVKEIKVTQNQQIGYRFSNYINQDNPSITLYKGNTYKFVIDTPGHPFFIMTEPFKTGIAQDGSTSVLYSTGVENNGIDKGTVTFTVPDNAPDILYYQCGSHSAMFGILSIKSITATTKIDVEHEITGVKSYTMINGYNLSNGMKVKFQNNTTEDKYTNKEFYVEGVNDEITLTDTRDLLPTGAYTKEETEPYDDVAYADRPYAVSFFRAVDPDYITIKRDSPDGNSWSRYNRWFHRAVIETTAKINQYTPELLETDRAKRPIIEFDSGLSLFNHGSISKKSVQLVDTVTGDVFSKMVNQTGYIIDGVPVVDGMRILITADTDPLVNNKIFIVNFVKISGSSVVSLRLTEDSDTNPVDGETVSVEYGRNNQGKTFYYDASTKSWKTGQNKTKLNQQPLFHLYDEHHKSFADETVYPNSTFVGAKLFEYKISDASITDTVLGLKVKYKTINNVGDILFYSDYSDKSFFYNLNDVSYSKENRTGHVHKRKRGTTHYSQTNWIERSAQSKQRVVRTYTVTPEEKRLFAIDVYKDSATVSDIEISVDVNHINQNEETDYEIVNGTTYKYVKFLRDLTVNDLVKISTYSKVKKVEAKGLYEVPENLSTNPLNSKLIEFTYGQILNHVHDLNEKNSSLLGKTPGNSNLRDLPDVRFNGGSIIQHQSPLPAAFFLLIDQNANIINAIDYCSSEYQKFKENLLSNLDGKNYEGDAETKLNELINLLVNEKDNSFPFFYEDMLGHGENVSVRTYTVNDESITEYAIDSQFDITTPSNRAVYVYCNNILLTLGEDYTFSSTDDSIDILKTITAGDVIVIKDYGDTTGSFVPPTPTKLGIYPKFKPEKILDTSYLEPTYVIIGHDGSKTRAFGDYRDDVLLELEKRIYNNIKTEYNKDLLNYYDVIPSAFKNTDYTIKEIDNILSYDFYTWAGKNGIDYTRNDNFLNNNRFTYNYSSSKDVINNNFLPGHWKGIFRLFYDSERPHTHPWEMLGYSEKPTWWESTYGPGPYTSGNELLWTDLQNGYDYSLKKTVERFIRPNLLNYLPVDENGILKDPISIGLINEYTYQGITKQWKFGDHGPAETSWRHSTQYPFTIMKMLALTQPAKFFSLFIDNSRLKKNVSGNYIDFETGVFQNLKNLQYHLEVTTNARTGEASRKITAGYQPFVVNYLIKNNLDPAIFFYDKMKNLNVQLSYKLGGFTDKQNLKILTDSVSPGSTAGSQFIPDENYKILFRTSNPIKTYEYSGVLIELNSSVSNNLSSLEGGYRVVGYNTIRPFFKVFEPNINGNSYNIIAGNGRAVIYKDWANREKIIPYGTVFKTVQDVVNFLIGYGKYLESEGFVFDKFINELKETANWETSALEFLYWTRQGFAPGSAITLSPASPGFEIKTVNSTIGKLYNLKGEYTVLDSAGRKINQKEISTKRIGGKFDIVSKGDDGIYAITMNAVQKEHIILFDNITVFSDIILQLETGFRQQRLKLIGWKTGNWDGDYYSPGFIFDEAKVSIWTANTDYQVGQTVEYSAGFYVAKVNHNSGSKFNSANWIKKSNKPSSQLIPNFDYKISQFGDFYNLETNNFDEGQQKLAQHLTGYQSRPYLDNLFANDISQYKFYQGFIKEKGTLNAIEKLTKAQFSDENITLNIYPEWMIKIGNFGNIDSVKNVQVQMPQNTFTNNIQSIEIVNVDSDAGDWAKSVKISSADLYSKDLEFNPPNIWDKYDYAIEGYDRDVPIKYKTAGHPRLVDVQHTAFLEEDLINLNVDQINNHDLVWIAKMPDTNWDVKRITFAGLKIISLRPINNNTEMEVTFNNVHSFQKNQYFIIRNSEYSGLNGVYKILSTPSSTRVTFAFIDSVTLSNIGIVSDESTADTFGNIYKFVSVKLASMNNVNELLSYKDYQDNDEINEYNGDRVFVENAGGKWAIYEKTDPYTTQIIPPPNTNNEQEFGYNVVAKNDGRYIVVATPGLAQGTLSFFSRKDKDDLFNRISTNTMIDGNDNTSRLGESLSLSTDENFVIAGAPYTNILSNDGSTRWNDSGLVKIYSWDNDVRTFSELTSIESPFDSTPPIGYNFGWAHALAELGENSDTTNKQKYLLISAPGYNNDSGIIYMYTYQNIGDSTYAAFIQDNTIESPEADAGQRFGHRMCINDNGDILAVSSVDPGSAGKVEIFVRNSQSNDDSTALSFRHVQTLRGTPSDGSSLNTSFGDAIAMSKDGTTLVISAPGIDNGLQVDAGAVYEYKWNDDGSTDSYTLKQVLQAPEDATNMRFGSTLAINSAGDRLVIGADQFATRLPVLFDFGATTFDLQDTNIVELNKNSGTVFTATKYDTLFVIDDKLTTSSISENDNFGKGIAIIDNALFVGSPYDDNLNDDGSTRRSNDGSVTVYDLKTQGSYAWKKLVEEDNLIDERKINSAFIFNSADNKIIDYLDYYDPIKGRILGIADREINYKTEWDPAIYNYGTSEQTVDNNTAWGEEHIGEVWWDLSTARWVWYEQGDQEYKTKNWGKLFPGSTIDIYEWIETKLLPSEWATRADTITGLSQKVSGSPLYGDNTIFTVKQKYNSNSGVFENYYYYWVKNSVFLPSINKSVTSRKNTTSYISNLITNPLQSDIKYFAVTNKNSLITFNVKASLVNENTVLNLSYKNNLNEGDVHSVWRLIKEGDKDDRPSSIIEKKWWDSLTGSDELGNQVPDINLPLNQRYGTLIRPRQSWYIDRFSALKEIIQYTNEVISKYEIANQIRYDNLNSADPEPTESSGEWDSVVDSYAELTYIDTKDISGRINVLVRNDEQNSGNLWAVYNWNGTEWNRTKVQTYRTNRYYKLANWYAQGTDANTIINAQLNYQYELESLILDNEKHVKVLYGDTGGWKIYKKTSNGFINVATENGTIQFLSTLYDYSIDATGFDGDDTYDTNFFDQEPRIETRKILQALRDDIFVGDLRGEYNNIFFIGLRKVLEEQLYVDWLVKTSFINVSNTFKPLTQRKTYTIGTENYVEEYINEIKPFHTKIREYKLGYTANEIQDGIYTDFDIPAFYDGTTLRNINLTSDVALLSQYPYRFWNENYKKYVHTISVSHSGSGYITDPTVTLVGGTSKSVGPFAVLGTNNIGASSGTFGYFYPLYTASVDANIADTQNNGDGTSIEFRFNEYPGVKFYMPTSKQYIGIASRPSGYDVYSATDTLQATARAIIKEGKVVEIKVLTPGMNYTATPAVVITGGGENGSTPIDTARAYANLRNDAVRDIDVSIKFDRVSRSASVIEWSKNTSYAVNDLIRYQNDFYKVNVAFTSTTNFKNDLGKLTKLRGDESFITASERTLGLYAPVSGMPGNELSQIMTGVDYGGVMVTGLDFDHNKGWDASPWYDMPWDNFGLENRIVFYGDGYTTQFTLPKILQKTDTYTVYFTDISDSSMSSIPSIEYLSNTTRKRQISQVVKGDGSTTTFTIVGDNGNPANNETLIELIPFEEDGVLTPTDDKTLDSLISGGLFKSVLGQSPSDINIDGDAFITPETSYAPEENLPGSIFDTVDIKVYTTPQSGKPFILQKIYSGDGSTTTFTLNYTIGSSSSILVSVSGVIQEPETAYNISGGGTQIVFSAAPDVGETTFVIFLGIAFDTATTLGTGSITGQVELAEVAAEDDLLLIYDTSTTSLSLLKTNYTKNTITKSK